MSREVSFHKPNAVERIFNRLFGVLVGLGLGLQHNYLLQVTGRKSGRTYSTPVNLLELRGKRFLVAGRGYTQWVRNAQAAGTVVLKRGFKRHEFGLRSHSLRAVCQELSGIRADSVRRAAGTDPAPAL